MQRKTTALLIFLLLLSQIVFPVRAQEKPAANNELVNLLYQPELVATIDVRRLNETVVDLFNNDPSAIEKLGQMMKMIEDETGIDPFQIEQFAIGLNISKNSPENAVIALKTKTSPALLAEKIFQNRAAHLKFSAEKEPISGKLNSLKYYTVVVMPEIEGDEMAKKPSDFSEFSAKFERLQQSFADFKIKQASAIATGGLNKDFGEISARMKRLSDLLKTDRDLSDFQTRLGKIDKDFNNISVSDPARVQKIAAVNQAVEQLRAGYQVKLKKLDQIYALIESEKQAPLSAGSLEKAMELLDKLPAPGLKRTQTLREAKNHLAEFQKSLDEKLTATQTDEGNSSYTPGAVSSPDELAKSEETIGGKRVLIIAPKGNYSDEEKEFVVENAIAIYSDNILLMGRKEAIRQLLNQPASDLAGGNKKMSRTLAKMPDSVAAFALDLQNVDLGEMNNLMGEQTNAWEVFGGITAVSREITLSVSVEKTDLPLKIQPRTIAGGNPDPAMDDRDPNQEIKIPMVEDNPAFADLFKLLGTTLIGAEGKITLKFDKRKTARLLMEAPRLLSSVLKNEGTLKTSK